MFVFSCIIGKHFESIGNEMIEKRKGVAIFSGTRMPVWSIVRLLKIDVNEKVLRESYTTLTPAKIAEARENYKKNKVEIEKEISNNTHF